MENLIAALYAVPAFIWIPTAILAAFALAALVIELLVRRRFKQIIRAALESPKGAKRASVSAFALKLHARWLEKLAKKKNIPIMEIFDFRQAWLARFNANRNRKNMNRLLDFYFDDGAFACFLVALDNGARGKDLLRRFDETSDAAFSLLKRIALSCKGRDFNADAAWKLLGTRIASFREMSGDPEWSVRHFAARMLLKDDDAVSVRLLWDFLADSNGLIRATLASDFQSDAAPENRARLFDALMALYLRDPVFTVRKAAKDRLITDFKDMYRFDAKGLQNEELLHVLELLDIKSKEDESFAFSDIDGSELERRHLAARFLQASGALDRISKDADFGDRDGLGRILNRLEKAASVNVTGFLDSAVASDRPATLYLAVAVLARTGPRFMIAKAADRVFKLMPKEFPGTDLIDLYGSTLRAVRLRGNEDAAREVISEIVRRGDSPQYLTLLLPEIPVAYDHLILPVLLSFLNDRDFEPREKLRSAIRSLGIDLILPPLFDILKSHLLPVIVRIESLKILVELKLPYLMQFILESLPLLPESDLVVFASMVSSMDEPLFNKHAGLMFASPDAGVRAAIIRGLPAAGKNLYIKEIREALGDADPEVRISALSSLAELDESKVINSNALALLRDPLERVRNGAAAALGKLGSDKSLEIMRALVADDKEVDAVKKAAIAGLGASVLALSVDILVDSYEIDPFLAPAITSALSCKTERKLMLQLIERFKDAAPNIRELIAGAFALMGDVGETTLLNLLAEDIASLKPFVCQALEASGYVDSRIMRLNHKDPAVRKAASRDLAVIATGKAFKGIVQAARDPDPEIRVLVTRALEFLNTAEGEPILRELEQDPDRRVRNYTAWAMERIRAKQAQ